MNGEGEVRGFTVAEVDALTGDDMMYWLENQFMTPELIAEKVCYWIARVLVAAEGKA
jgi:hypothetical protein